MHALDQEPLHQAGRGLGRRKVLVALCILILMLVALRMLPVKEHAVALLERLQVLGASGLVALALAYVFACVCFLPGWILTVGAGVLAASLWPEHLAKALFFGTCAVSAGSVAGATAAFLLGRTLMRGWVEERVGKNPRFQAIDEAIGRSGLKMVFLLRLSPAFPFNLLNYGLGVTKVRLLDYVLASWVGMLPATVLYVYLGTAGGGLLVDTSGTAEKTVWEHLLLGVGLVATLVIVILVTRMAKQALAATTRVPAPQPDKGS